MVSEKIASLPEMEGPTWPEDRFLNLFMQRRREMAHQVLTKGFLQLAQKQPYYLGPVLKPGRKLTPADH